MLQCNYILLSYKIKAVYHRIVKGRDKNKDKDNITVGMTCMLCKTIYRKFKQK